MTEKTSDTSTPPRTIGVREVAAMAKVSVGTVSNVLNHPDRVGTATRERVQEAMRELGFVPSRAAGQLRSRRSNLIGVVVPDVGNPFWATVLRGIEGVVDAAGLTMVVSSSRQDNDRQRHLLHVLESQGVDGLVIAPISDRSDEWAAFQSSRFGVVSLERQTPGSLGAWVSLDHVEGARMAMKHLVESGHRKVALINGPATVSWCAERKQGAVQAMQQHGLDPHDAIVDVVVDDLTVSEGSQAMATLLEEGAVTAVMCVNDMLALGALLTMQEREIQVPKEMALVGYDDADFAAALNPPLTTVHQPAFEMGSAAAKLLLKPSRAAAGTHVTFDPRLIVRESS